MDNSSTPISKERLQILPKDAGVYLMKDREGVVIYVGKAKNLKSRISSYFNGGDERSSIRFLLNRVFAIETLITGDERQALLLEADLIKKYKPRYNIRLKDDKSHLSLRIDKSATWPRLELVRSILDDGASYIGPFVFGYELRTLLDVVKRSVPLRTCSDNEFNNRVRPCLEYQIGRCSGPCCLEVSRQQYAGWVEQAIRICQGKSSEVLDELQSQMEAASTSLNFEEAARIRDRLRVIKQLRSDRPQMGFSSVSQDAFGMYREGERVELTVLMVRQGRLFEAQTFGFPSVEVPDDEFLSSVLTQYYSGKTEIPDEILLPFVLEDMAVREDLYHEAKGTKVIISVPQRGAKARLIGLAATNAKENFSTRFLGFGKYEKLSAGLQVAFGLKECPRTIECVDVSHFQGQSTVAAVVCFYEGKPDKSRYRRFNLTQEGKPDDFASMREVVYRHLSRGAEEDRLADLLIIDGGPGQLSQALTIRTMLGLSRPELIGLAKKRTESLEYSIKLTGNKSRSSQKPERIYVEGNSIPVILKPYSDELLLLEQIRDETHRFAISFHRHSRKRQGFRSALEGIQGLGPKRRQMLIKKFRSIKNIAVLSPEMLSLEGKMPIALAVRILEKLNKQIR